MLLMGDPAGQALLVGSRSPALSTITLAGFLLQGSVSQAKEQPLGCPCNYLWMHKACESSRIPIGVPISGILASPAPHSPFPPEAPVSSPQFAPFKPLSSPSSTSC